MQRMSRVLPIALAAALVALPARVGARASDEVQRIQDSLGVLHDLTATPDDAIPRHLLERAQAIVVIPSLVKGGFIIGAKHGRGVMSVRDDGGRWSSPAFVTMTGGSIGWQIGVESIDLVLLVMNRSGVNDLLSDKFTIGGNLSIAAGPVGRNADAATDVKMGSEILAYSRTKGLFAGASFEGASLTADKDSNSAFYGRPATVREIMGKPLSMPEMGAAWQRQLRALTNPE